MTCDTRDCDFVEGYIDALIKSVQFMVGRFWWWVSKPISFYRIIYTKQRKSWEQNARLIDAFSASTEMIPMVEERSEVLSETVVKGGNLWFFGVSISATTPCELMLALLQEDRVVGCLASAKSCKIDAASDGYVRGFAERWKTAWCRNSQGLPVAEEFLLKPKLDTNQWDDPLKTSTAEFTLVSTQPLKTSLIQGYFCRLLRLKPKKTVRKATRVQFSKLISCSFQN